MGALDDKVKLAVVVGEHAKIVVGFYQRFVLRQSELHREALRRLEDLEEKRWDQQQKMRRLEDFLETAERTATAVREDRERLSKELEEERKLREWRSERANKLEAE